MCQTVATQLPEMLQNGRHHLQFHPHRVTPRMETRMYLLCCMLYCMEWIKLQHCKMYTDGQPRICLYLWLLLIWVSRVYELQSFTSPYCITSQSFETWVSDYLFIYLFMRKLSSVLSRAFENKCLKLIEKLSTIPTWQSNDNIAWCQRSCHCAHAFKILWTDALLKLFHLNLCPYRKTDREWRTEQKGNCK